MSEVLLSCDCCGSQFYRRTAEFNRQRKKGASMYCSRRCSSIGRGADIADVFANYTEDPKTHCWNWNGCKNRSGYGVTSLQGRTILAHRRAWISWHEEIGSDQHVCHKCDNPACINPEHLFVGSHQDNMNDMRNKGRHFSKLSIADIKNIRSDNRASSVIAEQYGVSPRTVRHHKSTPTAPTGR